MMRLGFGALFEGVFLALFGLIGALAGAAAIPLLARWLGCEPPIAASLGGGIVGLLVGRILIRGW